LPYGTPPAELKSRSKANTNSKGGSLVPYPISEAKVVIMKTSALIFRSKLKCTKGKNRAISINTCCLGPLPCCDPYETRNRGSLPNKKVNPKAKVAYIEADT